MQLTNRIRTSVILCFHLAAAPLLAAEPAAGGGREIVAYATATTYVDPDGARLTFFVTAAESAEKSARDAGEKQVKKIQDVLASLPLEDVKVEVKVSPASVSGSAVPADPPAHRTLTAKRVRHVFQVTVRERNLTKLRNAVVRLAEAAIENGGSGPATDTPLRTFRVARPAAVREEEPVPGPTIEWLISDVAKARRDAIRQATREAIADAEAAAADGKVTVQKVEVNTRDERMIALRERAELTATGVIHIPIRVQVTVTCKQ
jgi:uncharacterized protein YggE